MQRFSGLLLLLLIFSVPPVLAQGRIDCSSVDSHILKRPVRYCAQVPGTYDRKDASGQLPHFPVLYYLHGLGDSEQSFSRSGGWTLIEDLREHGKIGDFLIVAPEGRSSFYINSADGRERYSDFFLREFLPFIEKKYRVAPGKENRAITGISMGGYGALRFAFAYPELFSAVSAQSAALILDTPENLNATGMLGEVFGSPINMPHWLANDPFALARKNRAEIAKMAIYFNCGQRDDYGFEKGAAALDKQLTKEKIPHEYHPYLGGHDMSYFLGHLAEVIEFHSQAFAEAKASHASGHATPPFGNSP